MKRVLASLLFFLPFLFGGAINGYAEDKEPSKQGWLGVSTSDMTPRLARSMNVKTTEGALVNGVMKDSPAEEAGIKEDDIIVEFSGARISDADDLRKAVRRTKPGTEVPVVVSRNDERKSLTATLEKASNGITEMEIPRVPDVPHVRIMPPHVMVSPFMDAYGLRVRDLNKQLGMYFGAPRGRGVLVEEVEEGSPADSAGFKAGDVIVRVQDEDVARATDIREALEDLKEGQTASIEVIRKGSSQKLSLRMEESLGEGTRFRSHFYEIPDFDSHEFRQEMKKFQEEMRKMGREIQSRAREWAKKFKEEFRAGTT